MTKIDIVSGFLGAGKTTLIKKLLKEALAGTQTVLIENEFGEIGIDGGFLKDAGGSFRSEHLQPGNRTRLQRAGYREKLRGCYRREDPVCDQAPPRRRYRNLLLRCEQGRKRAWLESRIRHQRDVRGFLEMAVDESERIRRLRIKAAEPEIAKAKKEQEAKISSIGGR